MMLRRQRVDLRSFLGSEVPLGDLSLDLRQRVRHALAGHADLRDVTAAVVHELLERGLLRRAGTVREGSERVAVYSLPHAQRVFDLRPLLGDPAGDGLLLAEPRTPGAFAPSAAPVSPAPAGMPPSDRTPDDPTARLVPIDAIRRTLERDWVSYGLEASLEALFEQLKESLGDVGLELWVWADRLGVAIDAGRSWRVLDADAGEGMGLHRSLDRIGEGCVSVERRLWTAVRMEDEVVAAVGAVGTVDPVHLTTAARAIEALLLAHRRSQERVYTDPLTGLANRGFFETQLAVELERARRTGQSLALLFADIDHFKRVNDSEGHEVGDLVLQHVARLLVQHLRRIDQVFRWGGEEFALLLPGTRQEEAHQTADRLRAIIERTPLWLGDGREVRCTISMGLALAPEHADGGEKALLRHADHALYAAKAAGRNRVVVYDPRRT